MPWTACASLHCLVTIALMPFSESVKVMLYARSGNRCAFPGCSIALVFTLKESGAVVNFGKAAHIVAESPKGPRGRSKMSLAERNSCENGIVFCTPHHTDVVDKFPERFTVQELVKWKRGHEKKYGNISSAIGKRAPLLSIYAEYTDKWVDLALLDGWLTWTAPMLRAGAHYMSFAVYYNYIELCSWLATRVWPGKLRALEKAFENFRHVASDLIFTFDKHADANGNVLRTHRFYDGYRGRHSHQLKKAIDQFEYHTALLEDLTLELTRAANLICDRVRESVDAQFRVEEGRLIVESGIYPDLELHRHVVQYAARELKAHPYPGLEEFMKIREQRDLHFGRGVKKQYLRDTHI